MENEPTPSLTDKPAMLLAFENDRLPLLAGPLQTRLKQYGIETKLQIFYPETLDEDVHLYEYINIREYCGCFVLYHSKMPFSFPLAALHHDIPFIYVRKQEYAEYDAVATDNGAAAELMIDHLFNKGHRQILYATTARLDLHHPSFQIRKWACWRAMMRRRLQLFVLDGLYNDWRPKEMEATIMEVVEKMKRNGPLCILCSTTEAAESLLHVLHAHKVSVPEDISVAGFGESRPAILSPGRPPYRLTTVSEAWADMGVTAAEKLIERLRDKETPYGLTLVKPVMIEGNTTRNLRTNPLLNLWY